MFAKQVLSGDLLSVTTLPLRPSLSLLKKRRRREKEGSVDGQRDLPSNTRSYILEVTNLVPIIKKRVKR